MPFICFSGFPSAVAARIPNFCARFPADGFVFLPRRHKRTFRGRFSPSSRPHSLVRFTRPLPSSAFPRPFPRLLPSSAPPTVFPPTSSPNLFPPPFPQPLPSSAPPSVSHPGFSFRGAPEADVCGLANKAGNHSAICCVFCRIVL